MNMVGPIGPLTVTDAQGQVLENSGVIRLRLGRPAAIHSSSTGP